MGLGISQANSNVLGRWRASPACEELSYSSQRLDAPRLRIIYFLRIRIVRGQMPLQLSSGVSGGLHARFNGVVDLAPCVGPFFERT